MSSISLGHTARLTCILGRCVYRPLLKLAREGAVLIERSSHRTEAALLEAGPPLEVLVSDSTPGDGLQISGR